MALNRMRERLRRHVQRRSLAAAALSHDMGTPLTRLRLRLESLPPGEMRNRFERDLTEIEQLAATAIEATRDLSPRESASVVDLYGLLDVIARDEAMLGHEVHLSGDCKPVPGRPLALKRAFQNLVVNAVKYGHRARISLREDGKHVEVVFDDDGPGIPPEHLEDVFAPYFRVEGSRGKTGGGTGLGLSIAKDIVEAHGGDLTLRNRAGGGLSARVMLPLA
jgi:signal transduction histidine kinase